MEYLHINSKKIYVQADTEERGKCLRDWVNRHLKIIKVLQSLMMKKNEPIAR